MISCVILLAKFTKPILFKDDLIIIKLFKSKSTKGLSPISLATNRTVSALLSFFAASSIDLIKINLLRL